ncbi:MAG TPA: YcaO-like family protein, partial [Streptosporangiaceae bacterium]
GSAANGEAEAPKKYRAGTHRLVSPAETLDRVRRFFPVLGITRVADITGLDSAGVPVTAVCRPNSRSVTVSLGKGLDLAAAKASGVMESIEGFMAERIVRPLLLGSFNDLRYSHPLADIDALPRTVESSYHPDLPILWIEGRELFTSKPMWVPYEIVHAAYTLPTPTGTGSFIATSNGLASGNHVLEAICHGICEMVERDAAALHSLRTPDQVALRRIGPQSVDDAGCAEILHRFGRAGLATGIWDMTTDIGIPAFRCLIAEREHPVRLGRASEGMGCHPDRGVALLRALTEAAQGRVATLSGVRDEPSQLGAAAEPAGPPPGGETGLAGEAAGDFTAVPAFGGDSFDDDVRWELARLRSAGIGQVIAVDLTREEFGIPVVRVVVPGLEGPAGMVAGCRLGRRAMDLAGAR